jgi:hypothetical protein
MVRLPSTGTSLPLCNFNLRARNVYQKKERSLAYYNPFKRLIIVTTRAADKSLARPGRKQATATEEFEFHISYL